LPEDAERVTSPWYDPETFFWQYQASVKKYKECSRYAKAHPDKMNRDKWYKLERMQKDAVWHETLWDRFEFMVKNPKPEPKRVEYKTKQVEEPEPLYQGALFD